MIELGLSPEVLLPCGALLGEGPVWDPRTRLLHFVDGKHPAIWTFDPSNGESRRLPLKEKIGFIGLTPDSNSLVAGLQSGLATVSLQSGETKILLHPEPGNPEARINDGVVDHDGGLIFGTMDDSEYRPIGSFFRYHPDDGVTRFDSGFIVSNGPFPANDGKHVFYVDSCGFQIKRVRREGPKLGPPEVFFDWPEDWGFPDGLTGDAEGGLWVAHWNGRQVTRIGPDGGPSHRFTLPTEHITKVWFGGEDFATLYITTASIDQNIIEDPVAGHLFAVDCGFRGLPANIAALPEN